jgi:hypothetical protein
MLVVANPGCPRLFALQSAAGELGLPPVRVFPWLDLIERRRALADVVRAGDFVRLESPGRNFEVERALLTIGADVADSTSAPRLDAPSAARLAADRGRVLYPRQWYLGFRSVLQDVRSELAGAPPHSAMHDPGEIALMFDKPRCHAHLALAGIPVPRALLGVTCYDALVEQLRAHRMTQVFVKLAHGSGASGVVAYRTDGRRHRAVTTVEAVRRPGGLDLYNTRRLRTLDDLGEIASLIDALAIHGIHVEEWVPKAGLDGRCFDLRVVVIARRARHIVPRLSRHPITNLHLLNARGDPARVRDAIGAVRWRQALETCERAVATFPHAMYAGVDLAITADFKRHVVLEINAFGDQLKGCLDAGEDTYTAELRALDIARLANEAVS